MKSISRVLFLLTIFLHVWFIPVKAVPQMDIATVSNKFSIDMYKEIVQSVNANGNVIFSPFSIFYAFTMLGMGAKGETKEQISKALHWGNFEAVLKEIKPLYDRITTNKNGSLLAIANKVWVAQAMHVLESFKKGLVETFGSEIEEISFLRKPEDARTIINKWVAEKTDNEIKDLFPLGSITRETRLVLANAIYFKGKWNNTFDIKNTKPGKFHHTNTNNTEVDYMTRKGIYASYFDKAQNIQLLEIPYTGGKFSMIFAKPAEYKLGEIEKNIDAHVVSKWIKALNANQKEGVKKRIYVPKFEFQQALQGLTELLLNLGIRDLFTSKADLSGINGRRNLFCSSAVHKAFIKVDEEGTTATAATGIVISKTSFNPTNIIKIDRPFLLYIIDKRSNMIIFSGRVFDPKVSKSSLLAKDIKLRPPPSSSTSNSVIPVLMVFSLFLVMNL